MTRFLRSLAGPFALCMLLLVAALPSVAQAATPPAPKWEAQMLAKPSNFAVGTWAETSNEYELLLTNIGGAPVTGPVEVQIDLAPGIVAENIEGSSGKPFRDGCLIVAAGEEIECTAVDVQPYNSVLRFTVGVSNAAPPIVANKVVISGGGAPTHEATFTNAVDPSKAAFGITAFTSGATDPAGEPYVVAGGHPTLFNTLIETPIETVFNPGQAPPEFAGRGPIKNGKDIIIDLPAGVVGNPTAAAECPIQVFLAQQVGTSDCPPGSEVGSFAISGGLGVFQGEESDTVGQRNPIFNLEPEPGYPAEFGFYDKGLSHGILAPATLAHTGQGYVVRVIASELVTGVFGPYYLQTSFYGNPQKAAGLPGQGKALLTNPSYCSGQPLQTEMHLDTWSDPAPVPLRADGTREFAGADLSDPRWYTAFADSAPVAGCEALSFNPGFRLEPDAVAADSPSGLRVNLSIPQTEAPDALASPPLRDATVQLPPGLVVNPSVADGLAGCTEAQLAPDSTQPGACPQASKMGTVTVRTPLIDHPLGGSVFIGTPDCQPCTDADAAAGRLLKLYIEINDPATGIVVKLPGSVSADGTGRLTASFEDNPQLPFEDLELRLKSGPRAPLTTPPTCGEFSTATDLEPWSAPQSGPNSTPTARFGVTSGAGGAGCASSEGQLPNSPGFEAGTTVPLAGTYSPFVLKVVRENGSQRFSSIETTLPAGLTGKLAGIPYCSEAAIAAAATVSGATEKASPSCPLASEIGTVNVGAGSGAPFYVQGRAYLAGPYKGAPLSLEIITPVVAGPFDLGTVAVRTALYVDETTAQIHAVSDPLPRVIAGVPVDIRSIALNMNRPQFTLNPTSCNAMAVLGSAVSTAGQAASLSSRFQVGACRELNFKPKLALSLKGGTRRTQHPKLRAVLTYPKGSYANIGRATVVLPRTELIDQSRVANPCTRAQFAENNCPKASILGTAKAFTPLLDKPLTGRVYFRSNGGVRELPDIVADLKGQIHIVLVGYVDAVVKKGTEISRVRNTFATVPDAPVSRFVLELKGGKEGLLQNNTNICAQQISATVKFTAQNAKTHNFQPKIATSCKK